MEGYRIEVIEEIEKTKGKKVVIGNYKVSLWNAINTLDLLQGTENRFEGVCIPESDLGKLLVELEIAAYRHDGGTYHVINEAKRRELSDNLSKHV
jgi:hypothetical protein